MQLTSYPEKTDLETCEQEPIHLIPKIQQHGFMAVLNSENEILQISDNVSSFIDVDPHQAIGKNLDFICDDFTVQGFEKWKQRKLDHMPLAFSRNEQKYLGLPHTVDDLFIIDVEPLMDDWDSYGFQQEMLHILSALNATTSSSQLKDKAAELLKQLLGYDRVMIYEFDENWNGTVVAESKEDHLESWKGLHYPAGDIPANARKLFLKQGVRILSNVSSAYSDVIPTINPVLGSLVPTGNSHLRGSSPIHIEYLKNMQVDATLNCAIVKDGQLWGLIACHHYSPKFIGFHRRKSCQLLSEMIGNQLNVKNTNQILEKVNGSTSTRAQLVSNISCDWDLVAGVCNYDITGKNLVNSDGFAVFYNDEYRTVGHCPSRSLAEQLIDNLNVKLDTSQYYESNCLINDFEWMDDHSQDFSGMLYHKLSRDGKDAVMWFRKEQVSQVTWGGKNVKTSSNSYKEERLSPRKSFEKWTEEVRCTSQEWKDFEKAAVSAFVDDLKNVIVSRYGEVNRLNKQLENLNQELESFSYSVSHDLRGPLRGIDGFAQILMEDYGESLDEFGKKSIQIIINSAEKMNGLMDDILSYSGLSKTEIISGYQDVVELCKTIVLEHRLEIKYPNTTILIQEDMPAVFGDKMMVLQLFSNLITNAFKYSSKVDGPQVEIGSYEKDGRAIYYVKDNGIGIDPKYQEKIFGVFTRLFTTEYEGSGVGLAIVQRIIHRHRGEIWVETDINKGATFNFYLENGPDQER
ncbi:multi-sensor signal transduction histidine kinase [Nonlabens sp. Hel1_33_55]|uniref:ATP-binding protein n=1 Tax=Nonlabens sp. Hel1_33_55 TaxID=1336802 RepID=UPI000875B82B|nr:ATP-binding protein [Nonlabens sp. Hel1_33_55]SCY35672.1 multi-sensor signal transduction histidine kinase [Nonlabens sp. Hel1_33_55]